jgi:5-methylcytosine-specific restriction enzyme subunit McrC
MRAIDLREYERSEPCRLAPGERDALGKIVTVEPVPGETDAYYLTPGSTVGALELGDLSVSIRPKLDVARVLYLASYAMDAFRPQPQRFDFADADTLVEALAAALVAAARRAFGRGLLHGYRTEEEALHTVRGRIVVAEQIRRRFDLLLPVEVRYDDFTDDVLANQLVKAAAMRLGAMRLRSRETRRRLGWVAATLGNVSLVAFPPKDVPEVPFDRLNAHYREVVELSRLILRHRVVEMERGGVRAAGFLMNMNAVFQEFVTVALRDQLQLSDREFPSDRRLPHKISLDEGEQIRLEPDLSWWDGAACTFVGDAKYKKITDERVPNADLYQLLAYTTALDLPGGLLIYAQDEAEPATYTVRHAGKRLEVAAVDLGGAIGDILASVGAVADRVRALRAEALRRRRAA